MIRTRSLVLLAVLITATPAAAQTLGVKGGVNVATQHAKDGPSYGTRVGLVAGGFVRLPLFSWLDVQADALYAMKGATLKTLGVPSTLAIDYFEVPVLGRVRFGGGRRHYFVGAGPSIATRLRARARTDFSGSTEELDLSSDVERLDLGAAAGGGVEMGKLVFDARYTLGLRDVDKAGHSGTKNRAISVTAGFTF